MRRVAVMAANAVPAKHTAGVHSAPNLARDATSGSQASVFAELLAQNGSAQDSDTANDAESNPATKVALDKLKKMKESADDASANLITLQSPPTNITALNATLASASGEMPNTNQDTAINAKAAAAATGIDKTDLATGTAQNAGANAATGSTPQQDANAAGQSAHQTQSTTADKVAALAAAFDRSVHQSTAPQATEANALPVHIEAQGAGSQNGAGDKSDSGDTKDSSQTPAQHANSDTNALPRETAIQPTAQTSVASTQPLSQSAPQSDATQSVVAQQPQNAPFATQSLQVSPQTAAQIAAAQPDLNALAVQIAARSNEGTKQFDIRLDPPELGRVEVKLSIDDSGSAQAHLTVEKPQTLDLMQHDHGDLERALKKSGINLSQNGLNFSLKGQEKNNSNAAFSRTRSRNLAVTATAAANPAATAASTNYFVSGSSRLDIRV